MFALLQIRFLFTCTIFAFYFMSCIIANRGVFCFDVTKDGIDQQLLQDLTTDMRHIEGIGIVHQRLILLISALDQDDAKPDNLYSDYYVYDLPKNALTIDPNGTNSKLMIFGAVLLSAKWPKLYEKLHSLNVTMFNNEFNSVIMVQDDLHSYVVFSYHSLYNKTGESNTAFAYNIDTDQLIDWDGVNVFPLEIYSSDESLTFYQLLGHDYEKMIFYGAEGVMPKQVNGTSPLKIKQKGPRAHVCQAAQYDPDYVLVRIDDDSCMAEINWVMKHYTYGAFTVGDRLFSMLSQMVITFESNKVGPKLYLARIPYEQFLQVGLPAEATVKANITTTEAPKRTFLKCLIGVTIGLFALAIVIYTYCVFCKKSAISKDKSIDDAALTNIFYNSKSIVESKASGINVATNKKTSSVSAKVAKANSGKIGAKSSLKYGGRSFTKGSSQASVMKL